MAAHIKWCFQSAATAGHPARDGDCETIRAGIPAAARRVIKRVGWGCDDFIK